MNFGELIRHLRDRSGLSREMLARAAGIGEMTLSDLEHGISRRPRHATITGLAMALGLTGRARELFIAASRGQATPGQVLAALGEGGNPVTVPRPPPDPVSTFQGRAGKRAAVGARVAPAAAVGPGWSDLIDAAAEDLALAVGAQWRDEERLRRLQDPFPLPVRWVAADADVMDHWANIRRDTSLKSRALDGQLAEVAEVFARIPSGRLVVLGEPGAGKSMLAMRFTLDFLGRRGREEPVPVIFLLSSWRPDRQDLRGWMSQRLTEDYPGLSAKAPSGSEWAWELLRAGRVLPVLDALDEIPESLRAQAIRELNMAFDQGAPVLITCRTTDYAQTVTTADVLTSAAVVRLQPLTLADLAAYLPLTARPKSPGPDGSPVTKWDPVLKHLRDNPADDVTATVLNVLSAPLMTSLARAVYSDTGADPAALLDSRFADPQALRAHLLEAFIPAAYSHQPATPASQVRYTPAQALGWLRFLARHMDWLDTRDLVWWQLSTAMPDRTRGLLAGLLCGFAVGVVGLAVSAPAVGAAYGLAFALASGLSQSLRVWPVEPVRAELRFRHTAISFLRRSTVGLMIGLGFGFAFALPVPGKLAVGLVFALAVGLHAWVSTPADAAQVSSPAVVLRQDRVAALAFGLSFAFPLGLIYAVSAGFTPEPAEGPAIGPLLGLSLGLWFALAGACAGAVLGRLLAGRIGAVTYACAGALTGGLFFPQAKSPVLAIADGILFGIAIGFVVVLFKAWGAFGLTRIWLAARSQLPWRLMKFLQDAHRRGVLRQTGGIYQFRHAQLQDYLASSSRNPP